MDVQAFPLAAQRTLVLIPKTVNYFYNQNGQRLAEAFRELGLAVDVGGLADWQGDAYDHVLLSNVAEILHAHGDEQDGLRRLGMVRARCRRLHSCAIDCVRTPWYQRLHELTRRCEADTVLDLGLHSQEEYLEPARRSAYRFLFSGLTASERTALHALGRQPGEGPIPWACVGHSTPHRVALAEYLIQSVDPRGFVYMPSLAPYPEKGSPHLNQQQFEAVLRRTRYQVWCSHHSHFYMEPERYRTSLLTGGLPLKVLDRAISLPSAVPFRYLMTTHPQLADRLTLWPYAEVRARYHEDWRSMPSLAQELARVLDIPPAATRSLERQAA